MSELEQAARLALDALLKAGLGRTIRVNQKAIDSAVGILCAALAQQAEPVTLNGPTPPFPIFGSATKRQAEPVDLDQQVRDITAGIGLPPVESPIVPDPVIDCDCGRRWCWTDDAGWNAKQAEPVAEPARGECRLWDSQWTNVVNHANCYANWSKEDAINHAVRMTETYMARNVERNHFPPRQAEPVAEAVRVTDAMVEAAEAAHDAAPPEQKQAEPGALFNELGGRMFSSAKLSGCQTCGIDAVKVMGYVCPRGDCPTQVRSGTHEQS